MNNGSQKRSFATVYDRRFEMEVKIEVPIKGVLFAYASVRCWTHSSKVASFIKYNMEIRKNNCQFVWFTVNARHVNCHQSRCDLIFVALGSKFKWMPDFREYANYKRIRKHTVNSIFPNLSLLFLVRCRQNRVCR